MFYWGASTSAHQVEGENRNDWTEWERRNARRLSEAAAKRVWPDYLMKIYPDPRSEANYLSGRAADHYRRFRSDFDLARTLGHNAHRFSIEWSRIEPVPGARALREIAHYREVIRALRERGIEPFVTIWHWTLPLWVRDRGGIMAPEFPMWFARYAETLARAFKDEVRYWITINEPEIYCLNAYGRGLWPPEGRSIVSYYRALARLIQAHRAAYAAVKRISPAAQVGPAVNLIHFESGGGPLNNLSVRIADRAWNYHFLNHVRPAMDFIGVNHYFHNRIRYGLNRNENVIMSDMGWELFPESIYHVLLGASAFGVPLYVTENGLADIRDAHRPAFLRDTLAWVRRAAEEDVLVRGYFHWSLLDNFEWAHGFSPRFGLVAVNYKTMARTPRPSALLYTRIIESDFIKIS